MLLSTLDISSTHLQAGSEAVTRPTLTGPGVGIQELQLHKVEEESVPGAGHQLQSDRLEGLDPL